MRFWSGKRKEFLSGHISMCLRFTQLQSCHFISVKTRLMFSRYRIFSIITIRIIATIIAAFIRNGGPKDLQLERFMEAVYCETAQLSYHALIGTKSSQMWSKSSALGCLNSLNRRVIRQRQNMCGSSEIGGEHQMRGALAMNRGHNSIRIY